MSSKKIIWESQHLEIDTKFNSIKYASGSDQEEYIEKEEDGPYDMMQMPDMPQHSIGMTPFGMFRVNDDMHPFKQFKLWMGHTNFNLSRPIVQIIQQVEGVELLRIISRYRFIVGIGKAFDTLAVKLQIERSVCGSCNCVATLDSIKDPNVTSRIKKISEYLNKYKRWSMLIFPNGNLEFTIDTDPQFDATVAAYNQIKNLTNSIVIQHGI